jgi:hypothetical protein
MDLPERPANSPFSLAEGGPGWPERHPCRQLKHCLSVVGEGIDFLSATLLVTTLPNRTSSLAPVDFDLDPERLD